MVVCWLMFVCSLLCVVSCVLSVVCWLLLVVSLCSFFVVRCLLFWRLLFVVVCLFVVCLYVVCSLLVVGCWWLVDCCVLLVA